MDTTTMNSPLVFGAMLLGTRIDQEQSFALLDRFVARGGQWVDTANCYTFWFSDTGAGGASEQMLGRWLGARPGLRDRIRLSTKAGAEPLWPGSWPQHREGLSRRAILHAMDTSLQRLGVEQVDLFWLHQEDRSTPMAQTVEALGELTASGKARRVGASNHPAWRVEQARGLARRAGTVPIDALQLLATYLHVRPGLRTPGVEHAFGVLGAEHRDHARANGLEIWAYSPLMSGSYDNPDKPVPEAFDHPGTTRRLQALDAVAEQVGATRSQVVLAWLLAQGIRPVIGVSTTDQLDLAMDAGHLTLTAEQVHELDHAG